MNPRSPFLFSLLLFPLAVAAGLLVAGGGGAAAKPGAGLLGTLEFSSNNLSALPQWKRVLEKFSRERGILLRCEQDTDACPSPRVIAWQAKIEALREQPGLERLEQTNRYINTWPSKPHADDLDGGENWASPLEFARNSGNAVDFAIMKFFMLRDLGFANDDLRLVVAADVLSNRTHAFVAASHEGEVYILDTLSDAVVRERDVRYYVPFYSVNETTRWAHIAGPVTEISSPETDNQGRQN